MGDFGAVSLPLWVLVFLWVKGEHWNNMVVLKR